ncbi:Alpha/Beta hydrolase protein [Penicillium atrosanguineum]|uniref:Alpha/Beta hydrolase protein n=1 Tax=Penicillium atrosanguineum TaxID=1132637 RepID=A0A9W9PKY7_9EURO|nr:Alpha/Beta hydrolase protein [Penicillium atrosanguineum]KAJ5299010.1 Alpha/Beta hydrolase protein [Penicillium atrosanguineum]
MPSFIPEGGQTLVYSVVDGHNIQLDYYLPPSAKGTLPAVIYYHGGGMTAGSRRDFQFPRWLYDHCQRKGYIFIAADYRLCHPSTAFDQIEDTKALFMFIASDDFAKGTPQSISIDTARIAVAGFSAGAFSARAACVYAEPKPAALLTVFGTCGDWLLKYLTTRRPPTSIATSVDLTQVSEILADKRVISDDTAQGNWFTSRFALAVKWELDGEFLEGCLGRPGLSALLNGSEDSKRAMALSEDTKPAFLQIFVTEDYPPSVFVHGTADDVVLPQESMNHFNQLKGLGVQTELLLVKDGPHGLLESGSAGPPKPWKGSLEAYERALEFIDEVLENCSLSQA